MRMGIDHICNISRLRAFSYESVKCSFRPREKKKHNHCNYFIYCNHSQCSMQKSTERTNECFRFVKYKPCSYTDLEMIDHSVYIWVVFRLYAIFVRGFSGQSCVRMLSDIIHNGTLACHQLNKWDEEKKAPPYNFTPLNTVNMPKTEIKYEILTAMDQFMRLQRIGLCESSLAHITFVWLFTGMDT